MSSKKVRLFNIEFDNINFTELSSYIKESVINKKPKYIVTCNVDHIVQLSNDLEFQEVYRKADIKVADGVPIVWASKLLMSPIKQKISGSDILPVLGEEFEKNNYKIFFLGSAEGVAEKAKLNLQKVYPKLNIVKCYSPPYGFENNKIENDKIIKIIKETSPDILFVGLGAPKQEKWIYKYYKDYQVPLSIGVGGTFDLLAGNLKRAPLIFQKYGLEWFWRLCQEPKRLWKRYLIDDSKFLYILLKEIITKKR
ncbi:WecB/TagA/CpsF family glycosyltransferase [Niallia circulans]|uniref:WecB/TagA/CpsF family glycosyltransferase n=1 Tax=Niallia circulans TaxID=1397 RepID=UPI00300A3722